MTLRLSEVCDLDLVTSLTPAQIDLPTSATYARGVDAILRRVWYAWAPLLLDVEGQLAPEAELRRDLLELAERVTFVLSARVTLTRASERDLLRVRGLITMIDGQTYPLEVTAGAAALLNFGGG